MKLSLFIPLLLLLIISPAFGALSDATGLLNRFDVETSGHTFEVESVANFDIQDFDFDKDKKRLTLYIDSGLENNLGEIIIPQNLLGGNFTFYLNDQEFFPKTRSNEKISFITLNFTGIGDNTLDIVGTEYLSGLTEITTDIPSTELIFTDDYGLTYTTIIVALLILGGIVGAIILAVKRRK